MMSATGKKPAHRNGFTLLEILIASAVLLIGFSLVAMQISRHLTVLQILEGSINAHQLADKQLIEAVLRQQSGLPIAAEGIEDGFSWSVREEELKPPYEALNVTLAQVPWGFHGTTRLKQLTTELERRNQGVSP